MQNLVCIIVALMIAGCQGPTATQDGYVETLNSWIGSSEASLVSSWGVPDSVYEAGGKTYLTYLLRVRSAGYTSTKFGNTIYTRSSGGKSCKTTLTVEREIIVEWNALGNNCVN